MNTENIKTAIDGDNVRYFETEEPTALAQFRTGGLNALFYAINVRRPYKTIEAIVGCLDKYFIEAQENEKKAAEKKTLETKTAEKNDSEKEDDEEDEEDDDDEEEVRERYLWQTYDNDDLGNFIRRHDDARLIFILLFKKFRFKPSDKLIDKPALRQQVALKTKLVGKYKGSGYKSISKEVIGRNPRSFSKERERQLLKQISTMIFFSMGKSTKTQKLVEVETMHLRRDNKSFLFIAANEAPVSANFGKFATAAEFKAALQKDNKKGDDEGKARTARYAQNFTQIFAKESNKSFPSSDETDKGHYQQILQLLRGDFKVTLLELKYELPKDEYGVSFLLGNGAEIMQLFGGESSVIFLNTSSLTKPYHSRHAEEFLVDVAEHASSEDNQMYACISGKKRPCMTCYSRMANSVVINTYGKMPGFLWLQVLQMQIEDAQVETLRTVNNQPSYITLSGTLYGGQRKETSKFDSGTEEDDNDME